MTTQIEASEFDIFALSFDSKAYKVDQFLQILQGNFQKSCTLKENISIDESIIKFKGRSPLKQHLPMKPIERGEFEWIVSKYLILHKWMDKKVAFLVSNFHVPSLYEIIQRKERSGGKADVICPTSVSDSNKNMRNVDRADQRKESYS